MKKISLWKKLKAVLAIFLAVLLTFEPAAIYAYDPRAEGGINAAIEGLSSATNINEALSSSGCQANIPGLSNPFSIPLCDEAQNFRNQMQSVVSDWMDGGQSPTEIGQNLGSSYQSEPPPSFSENMSSVELSEAGRHRAFTAYATQEANRPYGPEDYAYSRELWQPYIDLWKEDGANPYVADLTQNLDCRETVYITCENRTVTGCYEDACFGYQYRELAACRIYYDEYGNIQNECNPYESNSACVSISEECLSFGEECVPLPCYPDCSVGGQAGCCVLERRYVCIQCDSGTPVPNWTHCPDRWRTHNGICKACLIATTSPSPIFNISCPNVNFSQVSPNCIEVTLHQQEEPQSPHTCTLSVESSVRQYVTEAAVTYIDGDDFARVRDDLRCIWENLPGICSEWPSDCENATNWITLSGPFSVTDSLRNSVLYVEYCGGGDYYYLTSKVKVCFDGINLANPGYYCPRGYTYDPDTGLCGYYEPGTVLESGNREDGCENFKNNPNCTLISTECMRNENGNPVTDDLGNCYIYEYRYRCCGELGDYQECTSTSELDCSGISCIGYNCRPEETDDSNGNFTQVMDLSWLMTEGPFAEGEKQECESKKWLVWSLDCCDPEESLGGLSPLAYFTLAQGGYKVYRRVRKFLERSHITLELLWGSDGTIAGAYDYALQMSVQYESAEDFLKIANPPQMSVAEPLTGGNQHTFLPTPFSQVFQVLKVAGYALNPSPKNIIKDLLTNQQFRSFVWNVAGTPIKAIAKNIFGEAVALELEAFFQNGVITGKLSLALYYIGWALIVWEVLNLIAMLILGNCSEEELQLMARKKMGLCHYVGSYKKGGWFLSVRKKYKVYCCFNSPIARKVTELARTDWGEPQNPNCSGVSIEELKNVNWTEADMAEIRYYHEQTSPVTQSSIVEQGAQGNYGIRYTDTGETYEDIPVYQSEWANIDDVGRRVYERSRLLQESGAFQSD